MLPSSAVGGRAIQAQRADYDQETPATVTVTSTVLEDLVEVGIVLVGSRGDISDSTIRSVAANDDGIFGDGVALVAEESHETIAEVRNCSVEGSDRAGMTNFRGTLALQGVWLSCQAFDLHGEPWQGRNPVFEDRGQNRCGCPDPDEPCEAVSVNLEPPARL